MIKPQQEFPLLERYKKVFPIDNKTIFAYNGDIYCNYLLPEDVYQHELRHIFQQNRDGVNNWVENFLHNKEKRKEYELDAYRYQINSIEDKNLQRIVRHESAKTLSSPLYDLDLTFQKAYKMLK